MTVIVAATANQHKIEEYKALLASQDVELQSLLTHQMLRWHQVVRCFQAILPMRTERSTPARS